MLSQIRTCGCDQVLHRCGDHLVCRMSGLMCGFIKPLESQIEWHIRMHGAFSIPYSALGLKGKDRSCHHEVWVHLTSMPVLMNACHGTNMPNVYTWKKELRQTTTAKKERGPLKRKRPFARVKGYPYDFCFHMHCVGRFLRLLLSQDPLSVTAWETSGHFFPQFVVATSFLCHSLHPTSHCRSNCARLTVSKKKTTTVLSG